MAITIAYCAEDSGGPLSKEDALKLLRGMIQHWLKEGDKYSSSFPRDPIKAAEVRAKFDYACGHEQALSWAVDVVSRTVLAPETSKTALVESAEHLERIAQNLRVQAGEPRK